VIIAVSFATELQVDCGQIATARMQMHHAITASCDSGHASARLIDARSGELIDA